MKTKVSSQMLRLLYFSTARADIDKSDVDDIVEVAEKKNKKLGITGALAFNGRNFCQVLEGDENAVRALIEEIEADKRHSGFKIIDEKAVETRHFPDWSMQLVTDLDFSALINSMKD